MQFHKAHPNLSDAINANIQAMQAAGGVWVLEHPEYVNAEIKAEPVLPIGSIISVQTKNTRYILRKTGVESFNIQGHPKYCPTPTTCNIHGSTWGGSMLRVGWIGRGMHMEFSLKEHGTLSTSEIQEISLP